MSRKTNILLGVGYVTGLVTFWLIMTIFTLMTRQSVASAAAIQQAVSADLCMLADGRPALFEAMGDHEGIYATYLTKTGDVVTLYTNFQWDGKMHADSKLVIGHAECKDGKQ